MMNIDADGRNSRHKKNETVKLLSDRNEKEWQPITAVEKMMNINADGRNSRHKKNENVKPLSDRNEEEWQPITAVE
ncbi:hypothetical protein J6590_046096 [Homalodisca vitripennis]|nr:hypothetical protein J6590_046096 [Homalodisca vitripennis]